MATNIGVKLGIDGESEYRKALKNIVEQTKTLDKQMGTLVSSFDDETDAMEANEKALDILKQKSELLSDEIEMMNGMVEKAAEMYGESSTECQKWEQALADAQTQLNNVNSEIEEHETAAENAQTALGQLTTEISSQKDEMNDLRDAYINAVLEFGEGSDEAEELAGQIADLNTELTNNQTELDNATSAYDNLIESLNNAEEEAGELAESMDSAGDSVGEIGSEATEALSIFSPAIAGMVSAVVAGDFVSLFGTIVGAIEDVATAAWNMAEDFDSCAATIGVSTGLMGEELDTLTTKARNTWAAIKDEDLSSEDAAAAVGALTTALGENIGSNSLAEQAVLKFASTLGVNASDSVFDITNSMKQWGLVTEDDKETTLNMISVMNDMVTTQAGANISVGQASSIMAKHAGEMQILGLSYEEGLGTIGAFVAAGGDVSTITTGMYQASKNLNGEVEDIPGTWDLVISTLENATSVEDAMNATIGDTGLTILDVFNERTAREIASTFVNGQADVDGFTASLDNNGAALENMYDNTRTASDVFSSLWNTIKTGSGEAEIDVVEFGDSITSHLDTTGSAASYNQERIGNYFNALNQLSDGSEQKVSTNSVKIQNDFKDTGTTAETTSDNISGALSVVTESINTTSASWNSATSNMSTDMSSTEQSMTSDGKLVEDAADGMQSAQASAEAKMRMSMSNMRLHSKATGEAFETLETTADTSTTGLSSSMDDAKAAVADMATSVQNSLNFTWAFPYLALPHIFQSGSFNFQTNSVPSYSVSWYARAYGKAMELNNPTIFGAMGSRLVGGGEKAGAEVVVGESHLLDMFQESVRNAIGYTGNGGLAQIENLLTEYLPTIGNSAIYLDGDELVGATVSRMNNALANLDVRAGRSGY